MKNVSLLFIAFLFLQFTSLAQEGWYDVTPSGTYPGLHGIYAVDSENIWVVGEEGTILNTTDGGSTWIEITCPVTYPLYNVHFINADTGWVGGDHNSITEIMRTTDRGLSWELYTLSIASNYGNYDIEFIYGNSGDPPSGFVSAGLSIVWKTTDYGENWDDLGFGGCGANSLRSISFINKDEGWFVGERSTTPDVTIVHTTDGGQTYETQINPTDPDIRLNSVSFADNQNGIAAGVGSTILFTSDGGNNWIESPVSNYRWQSVHLNQSGKAWAIGRNGTIAYSTDLGYTWSTQESGVASELREVIFINDNEGWIVGGGTGYPGVILHTTNGGVVSDVNEKNIISQFELHQNYPNPFNPSTTIRWQLPETGFITLKIYDVLGKEVISLVNEELSAGKHEAFFDASQLSSGVYFYQLLVSALHSEDGKAGYYIETRKMVLLK